MGRYFRILRRSFWVLTISALGFAQFALLRVRGPLSFERRARWLQATNRRLLPRLGIHWETTGSIPRTGLIVSSHLSYLDVLIFSAAMGCGFVSKAEVRGWPIFGWFARLAGTVFVWRHLATDSARACSELHDRLATGHPVTVYPETTTSDGEHVLPFRATMFQAAIDAGVPVTPAAVSYSLQDGSVREDICFWGTMRPVPHALNIFSKRAIDCRVVFGDPLPPDENRKRLARRAYEWVLAASRESKRPAISAGR